MKINLYNVQVFKYGLMVGMLVEGLEHSLEGY